MKDIYTYKKDKHSINQCQKCRGECCKHLALQIDTPTEADDFENLKWYITHKDVKIFIDEGDWYLEFNTTCKYLNSKNYTCNIYEKRPAVCRDYGSKMKDEHFCQFHEEHDFHYEAEFSDIEALEAYKPKYLKNS